MAANSDSNDITGCGRVVDPFDLSWQFRTAIKRLVMDKAPTVGIHDA